MKKAALLFFCICFALSAAAVYGGSARLAALGSPTFMVDDAETDTTLYGFGYGAALAGGKARNTLSLSPQAGMFSYKSDPKDPTDYTYEDSQLLLGLAGNGINTGLVFVPSDGMVLAVRPLGYYYPGTSKDYRADGMGSDNTEDNYEYLYAGEVEFALKLGKGLAAGLVLGYTNRGLMDKQSDEELYEGLSAYKPVFALSAVLLPDAADGWSFGFKAGNRTEKDTMIPLKGYWTVDELTYIKTIYTSAMYSETNISEDGKTRTTTVYTSDLMCYNAAFGASREGSSDSASFNLGIQYSPKSSEYRDRTYTNIASGAKTEADRHTDDLIDFAAGVVVDAAYKVKVGDFVTGVKFDGESMYTDFGSGFYNIYDAKAAAGLTFAGIKNLQLPLEIYYDSLWYYFSDNGHVSAISYGASLGAEFGLTDELTVRAGTNAGIFGYVDDQDAMLGTPDNRGMFDLGLGIGAGYKNGSFEGNITLKWDNYSEMPLDKDYYKSVGGNKLMFVTDLKLFF